MSFQSEIANDVAVAGGKPKREKLAVVRVDTSDLEIREFRPYVPPKALVAAEQRAHRELYSIPSLYP